MPDLAKLSRQGLNGHLVRAARAAGIGEGEHLHAGLWDAAGQPLPWLLEGQPVRHSDLWDVTPNGREYPTARYLEAIARAGRDPLETNPAWAACFAPISDSTAAAIYAESFGCGRDGWGVAQNVFTGRDDNGRERTVIARTASDCDTSRRVRYPRAPKTRSVKLTTGGGMVGREPATPGHRWAKAEDQPGHDQNGYTVKLESTPETPARKRRGKRGNGPKAQARKAARKAARAKLQNN